MRKLNKPEAKPEAISGSKAAVCERFGMSLVVLDRLIRERGVPVAKVGRRLYLKFADVEQALFANAK